MTYNNIRSLIGCSRPLPVVGKRVVSYVYNVNAFEFGTVVVPLTSVRVSFKLEFNFSNRLSLLKQYDRSTHIGKPSFAQEIFYMPKSGSLFAHKQNVVSGRQ